MPHAIFRTLRFSNSFAGTGKFLGDIKSVPHGTTSALAEIASASRDPGKSPCMLPVGAAFM